MIFILLINIKMKNIQELFEKLEKAKQNILRLLNHPEGLCDMHGLEYRAWELERLRKEIKILL